MGEILDPDLTASVYDGDVFVAFISAAVKVAVKDEHNGTGYGEVTVLNSDPVAAQLTYGRRLRFYLRDSHVFTAFIESREKTLVSQNEEAGDVLVVGGRDVSIRLEEGCLLPYGGLAHKPFSDTRSFSWASPEYNCGVWNNAYVQYNQAYRMLSDGILGNGDEDFAWWADHGDPQFYEPWWPSRGWTWWSSKWLWSANVGVYFSVGKSLFAYNLYVPTDQVVSHFIVCSRRCRVFVDGLLAADWLIEPPEDRRLDAQEMSVAMTAGVHKIGIEVEIWGEPPYPLYGTLMACAHTNNGTGVYNDSTLLAVSDETWKVLHLPSIYPAPTPHVIMATALAESQAAGMCLGITLSSTPTTDSAGSPWATPAEYVFQLGDSPLAMVQALDVDWAVSPQGDVLHLWNYGGRGEDVPSAGIIVAENAQDLKRKQT